MFILWFLVGAVIGIIGCHLIHVKLNIKPVKDYSIAELEGYVPTDYNDYIAVKNKIRTAFPALCMCPPKRKG